MGAVCYRIKGSDGRGELELQAGAVNQRWTDYGSLAQLFRVSPPLKYAIHGGEIISANRTLRVCVIECIRVTPEEQVILLVQLAIHMQESEIVPVPADKVARRHRQDYGRGLILFVIFAREGKVGQVIAFDRTGERQRRLNQSVIGQIIAASCIIGVKTGQRRFGRGGAEQASASP